MIGLNLSSCATPAGMIASPGAPRIGIISPAPFGPGSPVVPSANFFGPLPADFGIIIIPGFALAKFEAATVASTYAALNAFTAEASAVND